MKKGRPDSARETALHIRRELCRRSILAMGRTFPNPSVGAVVYDTESGKMFSGGTETPGKRHAEIVALDGYDSSRSSSIRVFVTLEPCSRHGRTPPCTDRLIQYDELRSVKIFETDPTLAGEGIQKLKEKGIRVSTVREKFDPASAFLLGFIKRSVQRSPRFHFKMAATSDGFTGSKKERIMISGQEALEFTMALRAKLDAVLVGPGTAALDLPSLDFRMPSGSSAFSLEKEWPRRPPSFFSLYSEDRNLFLESVLLFKEEIFHLAQDEKAYQPERVFLLGDDFSGRSDFLEKQKVITERTGRPAVYLTFQKKASFWRNCCDVFGELPDFSDPEFRRSLEEILAQRGLNEILVEGGAGFFTSLRPGSDPDDELYLLISEKRFPIADGIALPSFPEMKKKAQLKLGSDTLIWMKAN